MTGVFGQQASTKRDLDAAIKKVKDLQASLAGAKQRIAEAQNGIARFFRSATTAASPIMGPNLLSAGDLAAFVRAQGAHAAADRVARRARTDVHRRGTEGRCARRCRVRAVDRRDRLLRASATAWSIRRTTTSPGSAPATPASSGFSFPDARTGVRAQVQLLRVYVDRAVTGGSLPDPLLLPGTLRLGFRGRVQTWWDLTGKWATASNYGNAIYAVYNRMVAASGRR